MMPSWYDLPTVFVVLRSVLVKEDQVDVCCENSLFAVNYYHIYMLKLPIAALRGTSPSVDKDFFLPGSTI
jgi:hypothetical protein